MFRKKALNRTMFINDVKIENAKKKLQSYEMTKSRLNVNIENSDKHLERQRTQLRKIKHNQLRMLCKKSDLDSNVKCIVCFEENKKLMRLNTCEHELCMR